MNCVSYFQKQVMSLSIGTTTDGTSLNSASTNRRHRFKRLVQGKTPSQLEKERAAQKCKDRRRLLMELEATCQSDRKDLTQMENYLNTKMAHLGPTNSPLASSFDYGHKERRNLELEKIAKRARRMSICRNKRIEDHVSKHSIYDENLRRAVIESLESKKIIKKRSTSHRRPSELYGPTAESPRESRHRYSMINERLSSRSSAYTVQGSRRGSDDDDEEIVLYLRPGTLSPSLPRRGK